LELQGPPSPEQRVPDEPGEPAALEPRRREIAAGGKAWPDQSPRPHRVRMRGPGQILFKLVEIFLKTTVNFFELTPAKSNLS